MQFNLKSTLTKADTKDKYIFWDIDGTLAPYRFNNHVGDPEGTNSGMSLKEIEDGIFLERKPSKHMQKVIKDCGAKENIIMSHCINEKEFPIYENESKADTILEYCKNNNISLDEIIFVDDVITILREAEKKGINAWHISSFLDWTI